MAVHIPLWMVKRDKPGRARAGLVLYFVLIPRGLRGETMDHS